MHRYIFFETLSSLFDREKKKEEAFESYLNSQHIESIDVT